MALNINTDITQSKDCKNFYFFDSTPLWNALSHPDGYDPSIGAGFDPGNINITKTYLYITLPDQSIKVITFSSGNYNEARLIADQRNLIQKTITYTDLGFSTQLADGIYKFDYRVQDTDGNIYVSSCYIVNDCQTCCCLDQKLAAIKFCPDCKDQYSKDIKSLYDIYLKRDSARILAGCGDYTSATEALQFVLDYCDIKPCNSCN